MSIKRPDALSDARTIDNVKHFAVNTTAELRATLAYMPSPDEDQRLVDLRENIPAIHAILLGRGESIEDIPTANQTRFYEVTVKVLVVAPPDYSRSVEKVIHGLAQDYFPGIELGEMGETSRVVGASATEVKDVGPSDDVPGDVL